MPMVHSISNDWNYLLTLTNKSRESVKKFGNVKDIKRKIAPKGQVDKNQRYHFPKDFENYPWNVDYYGLWRFLKRGLQ